MKKNITAIIAIIMMVSMTSCTDHNVSKSVLAGNTTVYVIETTSKNGEVLEEKHYTIEYETAQDAWDAVHG